MTDVVSAATTGFETASKLRAQADRETAAYQASEQTLVAELDDLQEQYQAKAESLTEVRAQILKSQQTGDSWSDAMDAYDTVLRLNGVERDAEAP